MHTITAKNQQGESSDVVPVVAGIAAVAGLRARYYTIEEQTSICRVNRFSSDLMELKVEQSESTIDHSLNDACVKREGISHSGAPWKTVPGALFKEKLFVEWDGLMNFEQTGNYTIGFAHTDGARLWVDGELVVNLWSCSEDVRTRLQPLEVKVAGVKTIHIEWMFDHNSEVAMQFLWSLNGGPEKVVPVSVLSHIPADILTYPQARFVAFKNIAVLKNTPVLFGTYSIAIHYTITPQLPAGLTMTDGVIEGVPTAVSAYTEYTVTAVVGGVNARAVLAVEVMEDALPSNITIKTSKGQSGADMQLTLLEEMEEYTIAWDGPRALLSITPELPKGVELEGKVLKGRPEEKLEKKSFTISLVADAGEVTMTFAITVNGCAFGHTYYTVLNRKMNGDLYITSEQGGVFNKTNVKEGKYGAVICLPPRDDYMYHFFCRGYEVECLLQLVREDATVFVEDSVHLNSWKNATFVMTASRPPLLQVPLTTFANRVSNPVSISYSLSGVFKHPTIKPALPAGVTLDVENRVVKGAFPEQGVFVFTLTSTNDAGKTEVVIEFDIDACPAGKSFYEGYRTRMRYSDSYTLFDGATHEMLYYEPTGSLDGSRYFCLGMQRYELLMESTDSTWTLDTPLRLFDREGQQLGSFILDQKYNKTESFALTEVLKREMTMRYLHGTKQPRKDWTAADFNEKGWSDANYLNWGSFDGSVKTVYVRAHFTVPADAFFSSFSFSLLTMGGFAAYLNGVEVLRVNLPQGELRYGTPAVSILSTSNTMHFTLSSEQLRTGANVLAVELHQFEDAVTTEKIVFDLRSTMLSQEMAKVSVQGTVTSSHNDPEGSMKPDLLFDDTDMYDWRDVQLPVWVRYTYPANQLVAVNELSITSVAKTAGVYPQHFAFFGVRNETTSTGAETKEVRERLLAVNNPFLFAGGNRVVFALSNQKAFSAYELEVYGVTGDADTVALLQLGFYARRHHFCPGDRTYAQVDASEVARAKCPWTRVGYKMRRCEWTVSGAAWAEEDESLCLKRFAGKNEAFIDGAYRLVNCTLAYFEADVEAVFVQTLVRELMVKKGSVFFYSQYDCTQEDDYPAVCVRLRLTPHHLVSSFVMMQLKELNKNITGEFYNSNIVPSAMQIEVLEEPVLRQRPAASVVVAVVSVSLLILVFIVFMIYYIKATMSRKGISLKQLRREKKLPKSNRGSNI